MTYTPQIPKIPTGLVYLAGPYSNPDPTIREIRFLLVCRAAAQLMQEGVLVFSPIAHTHPIAMAGNLNTGWAFWRRYDHAMLDASDEMWVLMLDGWQQSVGVQAEIEYMASIGKPIHYILPDQVSRACDSAGHSTAQPLNSEANT